MDLLSIAVETVARFLSYRGLRAEIPAVAVGRAIETGTCTELTIDWRFSLYDASLLFTSEVRLAGAWDQLEAPAPREVRRDRLRGALLGGG